MQIHRSISSERTLERSGNCLNATLHYLVSDCPAGDQSDAAIALTAATAPEKVGNAIRKNIRLTGVYRDGVYALEVHYALPEAVSTLAEQKISRQAGDRRWSFEVKTVSRLISQGKELIRARSGADNVQPPDPGTLLEWDGTFDGSSEVNGAYAKIPEITECCVATFRAGKVNTAFRKKIFSVVGKTNSRTFRNWSPGEVLLLGAVQDEEYCNADNDELVDITFRFGIRPDYDCTLGPLTLKDAGGWNVVWTINRRDPVKNSSVVHGVYETRIYDRANFSLLNL
ncbi:MAG: hypothetical protein IKD22_06050 [Lentisphaeria bacterium]|nr:hypothetical protein [Lentisphaeria bacterium]